MFMKYPNPQRRTDERDKELRPLHARLSIATNRRDKVLMRDLEKQIKAVHEKHLWR